MHLLTTIHFLMDAKMPARVVALGQNYRYRETHEVPDTVNAVLEYPEGFTVNLSSTFNNQSASESGFDILGTEAALVLRDGPMLLKPENVVEGNGWVVSSWKEELEKAYYDDPKVRRSSGPIPGRRRCRSSARRSRRSAGLHRGPRGALLRSGARRRQAGGAGRPMGHHAAAAAHMVNLSLRQRRPVEWNGARGEGDLAGLGGLGHHEPQRRRRR